MNEKKSTNWTAKKLAINALAIALVCVSTMVIQIPIPLGYMHLGNCCILLVSVYFGNMTGMLAGGIGSCLADLLSGYTQWIIPTLIIKGIMGLVIAMIAYREGEEIRMMRLRTFLGAAAGIVIMIGSRFCPDPGTDHRRCDRTVAVLCDRICI